MLLTQTSAGSGSTIEDSWRSPGLGGSDQPSSVSIGMDVIDRSCCGVVGDVGVVGGLGRVGEDSSTVDEVAGDAATPGNLRLRATLNKTKTIKILI